MNQEQLKEQFIYFANYNLNSKTTLEAIKELLNNISNELYQGGYTKESNQLTTCELIIDEILKEQ